METILAILDYIVVNAQGILALIGGIYTLLKAIEAYKENTELVTKKDKIKALMSIIPYVVRVVDDMVDLSGNEKAKAFMDKLEEAAKGLNIELTKEEKQGLKIIGSGVHKENQDWKKNYGSLKVGERNDNE